MGAKVGKKIDFPCSFCARRITTASLTKMIVAGHGYDDWMQKNGPNYFPSSSRCASESERFLSVLWQGGNQYVTSTPLVRLRGSTKESVS